MLRADNQLTHYTHPADIRYRLVEVQEDDPLKKLDEGYGVFRAVPTDGNYYHCYTCSNEPVLRVDTYLVHSDELQSRRVWCQSCYDTEYGSFNDESHADVREIIYIKVASWR
jgi:hypothetical protein